MSRSGPRFDSGEKVLGFLLRAGVKLSVREVAEAVNLAVNTVAPILRDCAGHDGFPVKREVRALPHGGRYYVYWIKEGEEG